MNVLIAANYATPASGNFIGSMLELAEHIRNHGGNASFIFPLKENTTKKDSWTKWLEREGFEIFLIDLTIPEEEQLKTLVSIIEKKQIGLLHIHFGLFHQFATHQRSKLPVKILIHEHMEYPVGCNHVKQTLKYMLRSALYRKERIAVVSVHQQVDRALCFTKHWYIPNALSFKRNVSSYMSRNERRNELGFLEDDKVVLFLGWDVYRKGLDVAVKAVKECRKQDENIKLAIVGLGTPPKEERLQFIYDSTGISPREPWIYYLHNTEDMFSYHRAADVYLSASRSEAFSYGLLEAISQDTPIVVSDIKGTRWACEYNHSRSYPVENHIACSDAILFALHNYAGRGTANRDKVMLKYDIDEWAEKIYSIYEDLN